MNSVFLENLNLKKKVENRFEGEDWRRRLRGELGRVDLQDQLDALRSV